MRKILLVYFMALVMLPCCRTLMADVVQIECSQAIEVTEFYSIGLWNDFSCCIVSFSNPCTLESPLLQYDGKIIWGPLVEVGVYKYETVGNKVKGIESKQRIVRAFMPMREYNEHCKCDKQLLRRKLDIVLYKTQINE